MTSNLFSEQDMTALRDIFQEDGVNLTQTDIPSFQLLRTSVTRLLSQEEPPISLDYPSNAPLTLVNTGPHDDPEYLFRLTFALKSQIAQDNSLSLFLQFNHHIIQSGVTSQELFQRLTNRDTLERLYPEAAFIERRPPILEVLSPFRTIESLTERELSELLFCPLPLLYGLYGLAIRNRTKVI